MAHAFTTCIRETEAGGPHEFQSRLGYKIRSGQHTHTQTYTREGKKKSQRDRETEIQADRQRQRQKERQRDRQRGVDFHFKRFSVLLSTGKWTLKL